MPGNFEVGEIGIAEGRPASESSISMTRMMMPMDANVLGKVFRGTIFKLVDELAGRVALRQSRKNVYVDDLLHLKPSLNYVGQGRGREPADWRDPPTGTCYVACRT